jgi:conjugal transfer pilin signal peptidase TrbI
MLLVALGIIAVNAAVTSVLISWKMPATVTFDMKGTIDRFTEQMSAQDSDEKTTRMLTTRFTATLNAALKQWQEKHDALILVRPAVVSGVPDITPEIQADIAQGMSGNKESEDSAIAEH